ncbi:uroporphyrinogen-III synthase [Vibrio sp. ZSDE26]|uniref:Uroporphyrinogen-III synthase n=1 Tax=Vibrio amylolyticus TaxID=2847292 RepID=A0A9X1XR34_9VIBR|nr:uroporphyrinogen-III synthase [Vibrio amylolyticus]MCK6265723.1 uroporphyrinogen-III synthase [Vibrio amylolyticus]
MTVLVTRPGSQGLQLCQKLLEVGIDSLHHPLITITPAPNLDDLTRHLNDFDIVIVVSQHAADMTDQSLSNNALNWPAHPTYIAVGQKTAHNLSKYTQQKVHYPEIGDSEHLLKLSVLQSVDDKRIVILRGNGGRELIYDTLVERNALVEYREVYQRHYLAFSSAQQVTKWQQKGIDSLVITSSGQLHFFTSQVTEPSHSWLLDLHLFVPSERIANEAKQLGFHSVINTGSASNHQLVAALQLKNRTISNDK